jgi:hypothetical protein
MVGVGVGEVRVWVLAFRVARKAVVASSQRRLGQGFIRRGLESESAWRHRAGLNLTSDVS